MAAPATPTLPPATTLPTLSVQEQTHILDTLFEPSPALHALSLPLMQTSQLNTYAELIAGVREQLSDLLARQRSNLAGVSASEGESTSVELDQILGAHPRLGEKKVESALSQEEQARMRAAGAGGGGSEEEEMLRALNADYERAFPGEFAEYSEIED